MCGIVGILGDHEVGPLLVNALKRLEYRGYDSAGIATLNDGKLGRRRSLGKLAELSDLLVRDPIQGKSGIGHTRWATHGKPSVNNAHPHMTEQFHQQLCQWQVRPRSCLLHGAVPSARIHRILSYKPDVLLVFLQKQQASMSLTPKPSSRS